ncbi:MAG TPA: EAL domain-containing protein [Rhizobiaceae bacterium]|nr:EAL domain-containing protein [Rhizobiaceae bacterium]
MIPLKFRYGMLGVLFGSCFPVFSLLYDLQVLHPGADLVTVLESNPLYYVILLTPFVLGTSFYFMGRSEHAVRAELARRVAAEKMLTRNAYCDALTGLRNRHALISDLGVLVSQYAAHRRRCLFLVDLDKFKFINDTLGHGVGDELLVEMANILQSTGVGARTVYRLGGDEFVVLWQDGGSGAEIDARAEALTKRLGEVVKLKSTNVVTGGSIGIAWIEANDTSVSEILSRADLALYAAKSLPGNVYVHYDAAMAQVANERMRMESEIRGALAQNQLRLAFQPIVGLGSMKLRAFEALLRWEHPTRGEISPTDFIPIAEASGLILPIGQWVICQACLHAASWPAPIGVAVNVSAEQFKERGFAEHVIACLHESGLAPGRLTLEITEAVFLSDIDMVRGLLVELRQHGVRIALDDFGTGFSSINHLRNLPLDQLKIDRSFTTNMMENSREAELVRTVVRLGQAFGITTTLEGVESPEQISFVQDAGISELQGFCIGKPVEAGEVAAVIAQIAATAEPDVRAVA